MCAPTTMKLIPTAVPGSAISSRKDSSRRGTLTSEASRTFSQMISKATPNAISSPESPDGRSHSDLQESQTTDLFGQEVALASHIPSPTARMAERKAKAMNETIGLISSGSSESESLQQLLESKLRAQFLGLGGIAPQSILKAKRSPVRRRFCELAPSGRCTKDEDFIGWPSPAARDGKDISRSNAFLSQRARHQPSMATRLLEQGSPWTVITAIYCLAMGFPSQWNAARLKVSVTQLSRKSQPSLSKR